MSEGAYIWCEVCGKKIAEGEAAYVRGTAPDDDEELELELDFEGEVWQCRECKEKWEAQHE